MNNIIATTNNVVSSLPTHEAIQAIKQAGYEGVEIWPEVHWLYERDNKSSFELLKKAMQKTGLKGVIHAPTKERSLEELKLNVCSKDEELRNLSIKETITALKMAKELKINLVNMHPGAMDHAKDSPKEYWLLLKEAFEQFVKIAEKNKITIAVEMMEERPLEFVKHPEDIKKLISYFNSENLGATLDIVHAFTHGEEFPLKHLEELGIHLKHFHVSGYYGMEGKTHCPFSLDKEHYKYFQNILKEVTLKYDGIITIEGTIKDIMPETKENQQKIIKENLDFIKKI